MALDLLEVASAKEIVAVELRRTATGARNSSCHYYRLAADCPFCGRLNDRFFEREFDPCEHFLYTESGGRRPRSGTAWCVERRQMAEECASARVRNSLPVRFHFAADAFPAPAVCRASRAMPGVLEALLDEDGPFPAPFGPGFSSTSFIQVRFKMRFGWRISCGRGEGRR